MEFYTVTLQYIRYCNYGYSVLNGWWKTIIIYRLSDDEREWSEIGELPAKVYFGIAALNGKIYIAGGLKSLILYDN